MLSITLRRHATQVLLGFVAAGFVFLLAELFFLNHFKGTQLIAVIAAVIGIIASLMGYVRSAGIRRVAIGLFVVLALSGVYGILEHREERSGRSEEASTAIAAASSRIDREALESFTLNPPVLSPLALSGMAILGILTLLLADAEPRN